MHGLCTKCMHESYKKIVISWYVQIWMSLNKPSKLQFIHCGGASGNTQLRRTVLLANWSGTQSCSAYHILPCGHHIQPVEIIIQYMNAILRVDVCCFLYFICHYSAIVGIGEGGGGFRVCEASTFKWSYWQDDWPHWLCLQRCVCQQSPSCQGLVAMQLSALH